MSRECCLLSDSLPSIVGVIAQAEPAADRFADASLLPVAVVTLIAVLLCVLLHWGAMELLTRRFCAQRRKLSVTLLVGVLVLLVVHLLEITLFTGAGWLLYSWKGERIGTLEGNFNATLFDVWYYTACVYTTVGFGDIIPNGPLQLMAGIIALTGLLMVTWSASFTFLVMQRAWHQRDEVALLPPQPAETDAQPRRRAE